MLRRDADNAEGHIRCIETPEALTKGWSFLHCLRSSASRILHIPDMVETFWKMMKWNAAEGSNERLGRIDILSQRLPAQSLTNKTLQRL